MAAPLFLLALPRSYTSLINAMIGQHPQAYGLPELCLFNVERLLQLWVREPGELSGNSKFRQGLLRAVAQIYAGEQSAAAVTMATHWAAARQNWRTIDVYRELAERIDPLIAVDKSPSYTISLTRMRRIAEAFPDARYLHLVRHPVGQCKSVMAMNDGVFALLVNSIEFRDDHAVIEPQYAWHDCNVNILDFLDEIPQQRQMRIRGEELMTEPELHFGRICRWLGIRDDADAIDEMMHPERSPFACFGPLNALYGNDPNFLRGPRFRRQKVKVPPMDKPVPWRDDGQALHPRVIELARQFGYE